MARKLRLEFPGACYHVISRGNYRAPVFAEGGAAQAFESCLFEACQKSHWLLHAFVVMRNHYHLALATPEGNLIAGMHWLQVTFATRFNKFRDERGHVFQGRYKAILVEEGEQFAAVSHYTHLNPVRAGVLAVPELGRYRYSSYWYLRQRSLRPPSLRLDLVLAATGGLADNPAGWDSYQQYLTFQNETGPFGCSKAYVPLSKGWALGSAAFKATLIQDHALAAETRAWELAGAQEIRRQQWEDLLQRALAVLGRKEVELKEGIGSQTWKVALAQFLREQSQASNTWIAERFGIKRGAYVSRLVSEARRGDVLAELVLLRDKCMT